MFITRPKSNSSAQSVEIIRFTVGDSYKTLVDVDLRFFVVRLFGMYTLIFYVRICCSVLFRLGEVDLVCLLLTASLSLELMHTNINKNVHDRTYLPIETITIIWKEWTWAMNMEFSSWNYCHRSLGLSINDPF